MNDHTCTHYDGHAYCKLPATHRLLVDGKPAQSGGYICAEHGRLVVEEYAPHGGWLGVWTMEPLRQEVQA